MNNVKTGVHRVIKINQYKAQSYLKLNIKIPLKGQSHICTISLWTPEKKIVQYFKEITLKYMLSEEIKKETFLCVSFFSLFISVH